ncbi:MAG: zf-HC2 domain-containing protein [Acidimicrobiia bacterium]|nr:zf-HC2 domain-containing protein [Acidimicrobiia bacterium]
MTDEYTVLAGAYVFGALPGDERRRFEDHLGGCAACRAEVAGFAPIPALLTNAESVAPVELPASVPEHAAERVTGEHGRLVRSRRRWRWVATIAAAAAVVLLAVLVRPAPAPEPDRVAPVASGPVIGAVTLHERAWGTALSIELEGLPQRDRYVLWVVGPGGMREQAAIWGPTPAGVAIVAGASSIPTGEVRAVVVADGTGSELATGEPGT